MLDVSEATIRRDLEWLEQEGIVERTHGGAILNQRINLEPTYHNRTLRNPEEKRKIGILAASLIKDGDIVFINSGTTTTQVIRNIQSNSDVTIITNNLSAAIELGEVDFELILLGGSFQPKSNSVAGRFGIENLRQIYATKAFIGVDGISLKYGCTVPSNGEAEIVRLMLERTRGPVTILADHSKWGVVSNFEVAKIEEIHRFITDDCFDPRAQASLATRSVEVLIAGDGAKKI
jgi:DeoR family fructose operon transcriptional repressor